MSKLLIKRSGIMVLPLVVAMTSMSIQAEASNSKVITDITFSGLQRITPDSLYPMLSINVGRVLDEANLAKSIESLYASGNFSNVQAKLEGSTLHFFVEERPIIAELNFDGNKLIPDKGLKKGLKQAGLAEGEILKQSTLVGVANELQNQYLQKGYYDSDIDVKQELIDGNRAKVDLKFHEGKPAKVVEINIIGNKYFTDEDIKDVLALKESSWRNLLSKSDNFTQERLNASLENLKALYLNSGFVRFSIENSSVNVSDDKKSIHIEFSVNEGSQYKFGKTSFLGQHPFEKSELSDLISFEQSEEYSQEKLDDSVDSLKVHFGNDGFYFAQIRPVKKIDDVNKTVDVDFYLDPERPVYVRRISFLGNTRTKDEVLRREMRQLEGALASNEKIQLSRSRLMRTGYFKGVEAEIKPVPNHPDQIDIIYNVEEQSTGSSSISAGYSQSGGVTFQVDMNQRNFLGTGNKISASISRSETRDYYNIGYTDPFFTENGVSQTINGYYRKTKYDNKNVSNYVTDSMGGTLRYGYPVDENIRVSAGVSVDNTDLRGGRWMGISNVDQLIKDGGEVIEYGGKDAGTYNFNKDYTTYNLLLGWDYSSLDKPVFPTKGMSHSVDLTLGFGDKTYQKAIYKGNIYQPIYKDFIARGYAKLGYGNELPFYENFYAGGYGSVRGYDASSLGPRSTTFYDTRVPSSYAKEEVGGNALATFGTELILPMPFKGDWANQVRPVLFVEGGQVFDTTGREEETFVYKGKDTKESLIEQDNELRFSAGLGMTWYTPIGPISISYSKPFNDKEGDKTEKVQFQIGNTF